MNLPYFYIIQHKSGRKYAGIKVSNADPTQLLNANHKFPYFTSSKIVKNLLKEDENSFIVINYVLCESKDHAYDVEYEFLNKALSNEPEVWLNQWKGGKQWSMAGIKHTPEAKLKISLSKLGKPRSDGVKLNLSKLNSGINNPFYGKMHSPETLIQMRVSRRTIICPHCFKEGGANVMHKHHFDNCHLMVGKKSFGPYKRTDFICPHCLKEGAGPNMKRYHFDNCKFFKE